ncbi:MAG: chemotaxis protein CheA [Syntrophales bacterium]|jgi:two-component system chemotaxis sensor kinase CheA|nr:chemotaxis protein CheA [Syntrophales bacterium]MDY0043366.1 chemotaxis protein CheA [Syntrophales bacterium]
MNSDNVIENINKITSDFLLLDTLSIEIRMAGKFLNSLEEIIALDKDPVLKDLSRVAKGISVMLENMILERLTPGEAYEAFEKGISVMQDMSEDILATGVCRIPADQYLGALSPFIDAPPEDEKRGEGIQETHESEIPSKEEKAEFKIQDESLMKDFITEGLEYIGEIEINILNLEQNPDNKEYINAVFRPFHSIKGVAGFLDLKEIRDLSHDLETLLDRARNNEINVNPDLIDVVLEGADLLKEMIGSLNDVIEGVRSEPAIVNNSELRKKIASFSEEPLKEEKGVKKLGTILVEDGVITTEILEKSLQKRTGTSKKIGETLIEEGRANSKQVLNALRKQSRQIADTNTIRVDVKKLDDFVDMIGELVITHSMIKQNIMLLKSDDRKLMSDISQLSGITSELQRTSTSLRMVPIRQTFQRMARLARDLARNAGKDLEIQMVGEDTEIDRNMVEEIYNPLVHMVRNAVDHGLESSEMRIETGKPARGLLRLKAFHKGGSIIIEISDDGGGLCKEKILGKARDKGLISGEDEFSDQEIYRLLFLPGFSTAEAVTDVSGRGVGMDVVKQTVDTLRGKIEIKSIEGEGTTFTIFFPLTMAIIDGMIVRVGSEKYIIPTTAIRRLLRPSKENYTRVVGKGEMLNVMGDLMPLLRLHDVFEVTPMYRNPWDALVVVVDAGNRSKCVLVDEVLEKGEVVIKSLGGDFKNVKGTSGGAILGDGNVGLIIDPEGLFELGEGQIL